MQQQEARRRPAFTEVGLSLEPAGDELHGTVEVLPLMWAAGSTWPMISVAATWADTQLGIVAMRVLEPRLVVTVELGVHLFGEIAGVPDLRTVARLVRAGSSTAVVRMDITTPAGQRVGFSHATFMAPSPDRTMPSVEMALAGYRSGLGTLEEPFTARVGCERTAPGETIMPLTQDVMNGARSIQGGLLTAAVEEAARSADPEHRPLEYLHVRYLRPVRVGPAIARAIVHQGVGEVDVHDSGTDTLALIGTTRAAAH